MLHNFIDRGVVETMKEAVEESLVSIEEMTQVYRDFLAKLSSVLDKEGEISSEDRLVIQGYMAQLALMSISKDLED